MCTYPHTQVLYRLRLHFDGRQCTSRPGMCHQTKTCRQQPWREWTCQSPDMLQYGPASSRAPTGTTGQEGSNPTRKQYEGLLAVWVGDAEQLFNRIATTDQLPGTRFSSLQTYSFCSHKTDVKWTNFQHQSKYCNASTFGKEYTQSWVVYKIYNFTQYLSLHVWFPFIFIYSSNTCIILIWNVTRYHVISRKFKFCDRILCIEVIRKNALPLYIFLLYTYIFTIYMLGWNFNERSDKLLKKYHIIPLVEYSL